MSDESSESTEDDDDDALACSLATLNINGVKAYVRPARKRMKTEGVEMGYIASDKMAEVAQIMRAHGLGVFALVDAHARASDRGRIQAAMCEHLPSVRVHIHSSDHSRVGGIVMLYDTSNWKYEAQQEWKMKGGHIAHGILRSVKEPTHTPLSIVSVYMPARLEGTPCKQHVQFWEQLQRTTRDLNAAQTVVMGDFNAEPAAWLAEGKGKQHWANDCFHDLEMQGYTPTIQHEATYAAGTLIDNILIPSQRTESVSDAYTVRGFSDGDHRAVVCAVQWTWATQGRDRPVASVAHHLTEEQVQKYDEAAQRGITKMKFSMNPAGAMEDLQNMLSRTAALAAGRQPHAYVGTPSTQLRGGGAQQSSEQEASRKAHDKAARWARLHAAALRWSGSRSRKAFAHLIRALKKDIPDLAQVRTRKERRRLAIQQCENNKRNAEREVANTAQQRKGDQIIRDIQQASANKGEVRGS